jgi:hypothetical protein
VNVDTRVVNGLGLADARSEMALDMGSGLSTRRAEREAARAARAPPPRSGCTVNRRTDYSVLLRLMSSVKPSYLVYTSVYG